MRWVDNHQYFVVCWGCKGTWTSSLSKIAWLGKESHTPNVVTMVVGIFCPLKLQGVVQRRCFFFLRIIFQKGFYLPPKTISKFAPEKIDKHATKGKGRKSSKHQCSGNFAVTLQEISIAAYPTLGKGKSSSNRLGKGYDSSQEGSFMVVYASTWHRQDADSKTFAVFELGALGVSMKFG